VTYVGGDASLTAWLPDGSPFVTNAEQRDVGRCCGPDHLSDCPALREGQVPECEAAVWVLRRQDGRCWTFRFQPPLHTCPITLLSGSSGFVF
jgi:hypothetical protein